MGFKKENKSMQETTYFSWSKQMKSLCVITRTRPEASKANIDCILRCLKLVRTISVVIYHTYSISSLISFIGRPDIKSDFVFRTQKPFLQHQEDCHKLVVFLPVPQTQAWC